MPLSGLQPCAGAVAAFSAASPSSMRRVRSVITVFQGMVTGRISDERFTELSADYEAEQKELKEKAAALQGELSRTLEARIVKIIDREPVFRFPACSFVYALLSAFSCFTSSRGSPAYSAIFSSVSIPSANILLAVFIAPSFTPSCKDSFLISSMTLHMIKMPSLLSLKKRTLSASVV